MNSHVGYLVLLSFLKLGGQKYLLLSLFCEGASRGNNSYYDIPLFPKTAKIIHTSNIRSLMVRLGAVPTIIELSRIWMFFEFHEECWLSCRVYLELVCYSGCLIPVIICFVSHSSVSWLTLNLHFLAYNLHLATKSSIFSVFFCLYSRR